MEYILDWQVCTKAHKYCAEKRENVLQNPALSLICRRLHQSQDYILCLFGGQVLTIAWYVWSLMWQ